MIFIRRLGCAVVLLIAGLGPTTASSAQARSAVVVDGEGDVTVVTYGQRRSTSAPAPYDTTRDIVRVEVDYRKRFVVAVVHLRDVRGQGKSTDVLLRLKGGGNDSDFARSPGGRLFQFQRGAQTAGACRGGTYAVDPVAASVRFRVPARCLGAPDRVRFGTSTLGASREANEDNRFTIFVDDARTTGRNADGFQPTRLGGPAVPRG